MRKILVIFLLSLFVICEVLCACFFTRAILYPIKQKKLINECAKKYDIPKEILYSTINVESHFNAKANSSAGALGLMQILPTTANYITNIYGINYENKTDLFIPRINIEIGSAYLNYLIKKFKNLNTVFASYNAGETVVKDWLKNPQFSTDGITLNYIPYSETKSYIKKINQNIKIYETYPNKSI